MSLHPAQVEALLRPINLRRVMKDNKGFSHVSQQDIRAHLTRIFGFGGWSTEILRLECIAEERGAAKGEKAGGHLITYRCVLRLTVKDPDGNLLASFDDVGSGTSPNLPSLGDAHDFAAKVAVSGALKRAATNLGDGFGLSLYNKGQTAPLVIDTLVRPGGRDVQDEVPVQVSLGHDDEISAQDHHASAETPPASVVPPSPGTSPSATPDVVEQFRGRVLAATRPQELAHLGAEIAKAKLLREVTVSETGTPITLGALLNAVTNRVTARAS